MSNIVLVDYCYVQITTSSLKQHSPVISVLMHQTSRCLQACIQSTGQGWGLIWVLDCRVIYFQAHVVVGRIQVLRVVELTTSFPCCLLARGSARSLLASHCLWNLGMEDYSINFASPPHIQEEGISHGHEYQTGGDHWGPYESLLSTGMESKMPFYKKWWQCDLTFQVNA